MKKEFSYYSENKEASSQKAQKESETPGYEYDPDINEFIKREKVPDQTKTHRNWHVIDHDPVLEECLHLAHDDILDHLEKIDPDIVAPKIRSRMLKDQYAHEYIKAEIVELQGIEKHGTFESVIRTPDIRPITCRWCYDIKRNKDGTVERFKARLVVHGFKQIAGVDFNKTFSSTAQIRSFRLILALATELDLKVTQYDISNAFLNGKLKETVYMEYPPGYPSKVPGRVIKLIKALYGLKQASRVWQETLYECLGKLNLVPCKSESGVLKYMTKDGTICIIFAWVDDLHGDSLQQRSIPY